jgi:hypothetical protein
MVVLRPLSPVKHLKNEVHIHHTLSWEFENFNEVKQVSVIEPRVLLKIVLQ